MVWSILLSLAAVIGLFCTVTWHAGMNYFPVMNSNGMGALECGV